MVTRRRVLQSGVAAVAMAAVSRRGFAAVGGAVQLRQLEYGSVVLLPGPMQEQFAHHHGILVGMNDDSLLKPFRERVGQTAPGEDMGGWYSNTPYFDAHGSFDGYVPGHSFGQYLSGLARAGAITGDAATQTKVAGLVAGIAPTLEGRFYDGYVLPAYTFDKTCCGLQEAYGIGKVKAAGPALEQAVKAALPHLPEKALSREEMRARPHWSDAQTWDESYTLPENLFLAYQRTGRPEYRDAAVRFLEDDTYFGPLSEEIDVLPGEHAYSHVNALSSAMQAYLTLGSEKHLRAAKNGFKMVEAQSYATGGWGPGETLLRAGTDDLGRSVLTQSASFETPCGAYGHFKITRYLLRVTGDAHYGDSMERVLYNTVLGAKPLLADGSSFYYSDFTMEGRKVYSRDKWPCCSGTLPQVAADYGISSYLGGVPAVGGRGAEANGLTVVLFVPSKVTWEHAGSPVTLTQETQYPAAATTLVTLGMRKEAAFGLAVRIPAWAGKGTRVLVNGRAESGVTPGEFLVMRRTWRDGDRVEMEMDMPLRVETLTANVALHDVTVKMESAPLQDGPKTVAESTPKGLTMGALMRGPRVYMATGHWPVEIAESALLGAQVASDGESMTVGTTVMRPYTAIGEESYRTYQPLK